ncbi:MAG TPA: F0F1 ATP synthase subunit B [Streptosporangiaceae bacterium]
MVVNPPTNPLIPEWPELIIGALAFLIVFAVLGKVLLPRIQKTLAERTDAIEGGLERAQEAQAEADQVLQQYRQQLAEAQQEASRLREQAQEQGAAIIADMREVAQTEARRIIDAAHAQIETDRMQAMQALRTDVGAMAVDLAGRVVGESLEDVARQRRIVERFIEDLEQPQADEARSAT